MADDHAAVRQSLCQLLAAHGDIAVVGDAADGWEAVCQVERLCPDVVIMDIVMPSLNGVEASKRILELLPQTRIVVLSMYATRKHVESALAAGVHAYVVKEHAGSEVVEAVRAVYRGGHYFSSHIAGEMSTE
ncbi:MAG: response regulator [Anaerolineae bacterium]